jgi:hypothetical protein
MDIKKGKYGKYEASCILISGKMTFYFTYTLNHVFLMLVHFQALNQVPNKAIMVGHIKFGLCSFLTSLAKLHVPHMAALGEQSEMIEQ